VKGLLAALMLLAPRAGAQEAASFLKVGVGARALGMGGAYTALADDAAAGAWNPAGLAAVGAARLDMTHAELYGTGHFDFLGYAQPTPAGTFGVSARRLGQDALEGRDASGGRTGSFGAVDTAFDLSYGARAVGRLSLGAGVTFVRSALAEVSAQTVAFHLGALYRAASFGPGAPQFGISVENAGPGLRYLEERWPLPLTLAAGAAYRLRSGLTLALDLRRRPRAGSSEVSLGTEYRLGGGFALRAGYVASRQDARYAADAASIGSFAGGFGYATRRYGLDYAITPNADLGQVHRFSLSARF
jgi:hypothetical protein